MRARAAWRERYRQSILLRILSGLTSDNPIGTPLSEINKTHGLEEFTRRAPWVLDEAFNISVWHLSDYVKAIISPAIHQHQREEPSAWRSSYCAGLR